MVLEIPNINYGHSNIHTVELIVSESFYNLLLVGIIKRTVKSVETSSHGGLMWLFVNLTNNFGRASDRISPPTLSFVDDQDVQTEKFGDKKKRRALPQNERNEQPRCVSEWNGRARKKRARKNGLNQKLLSVN